MAVNPTGNKPVQPQVQTPKDEAPREPTADMVRDGLDSLFAPPGSFERVDSSVQDIIGGRGQKVAKDKGTTSFGEIAKGGVDIGKPGGEGRSGQISMTRGPGMTSVFAGGSPENARAAMAHGGLLSLSKNRAAAWQPRLPDTHRPESPAFTVANAPNSAPKEAKGPQTARLQPTHFGVHDFDLPRGPVENMSQGLRFGLSPERYGVLFPYDPK